MRRYSPAEHDLFRQIKFRVYSFLLKYAPKRYKQYYSRQKKSFLFANSFTDYLAGHGLREVHFMAVSHVVSLRV